MRRGLAFFLVAGLLLAACGTISDSNAVAKWESQSNFLTNNKVVLKDIRHSVTTLQKTSSSAAQLHTVCGVLLVDTETSNASLPTPDDPATKLLSKAYTDFGSGANECYNASSSSIERDKAITSLSNGLNTLSEAVARMKSVMKS